ncbi:tRNA dihydrouridine(20/20a) synthase DusA [Prochlorococcus marinus]|uniref:tRNA-dihydrouridine(20/20a) synthase n=1 Tax=Prochlorococcus marinus XMU1408 TaxID=2213228 RepID=A0A318RIB8_PROMR|nr:tRNA dihydrouridine(20/20a) synthase DusA [Prochlorococcus marinus]MBW3042576.1 tRNA dihydrouridine(20/20a) synthase DusA [Prochlorococcus marinus str. XMU1408]PYE03622.1 tRNA dihydrouridine(20/20a) synthase DusA [Prochlorococcus marinus XMU1408]
MISKSSTTNELASYRISIAPMMDCTDRHFRVLMRQITERSLLYTEMIVAQALHYSKNRKKLLDFDEIEHPISIQLAGDNPILLAEAAEMAEDWGYDEINLNIGCPSPKVKSGNFGACLMGKPKIVANCIERMKKSCNIPITVKHRLGIDNLDSDDYLIKFVDICSIAGADRFIVHARKAWLNGLNPKENRTIPPLQYERVQKLKNKRPELIIELNGGINTINECLRALQTFDGAMVGRAAYSHPYIWKEIDSKIYGEKEEYLTRSKIIKKIIPFTQKHLENDGRLWNMAKHILNLIENIPNAKMLRQELSEKCQNSKADISVLKKIALQLEDAGL